MSQDWYTRFFNLQSSKNVWQHLIKSSVLSSFLYGLISNSQTSKNVLKSGAGCSPEQNPCVLSSIYSCVLSICLCREFSCGVNIYRDSSWMDGKRCISLVFPKSILFLFYLVLYLSPLESLRVRSKQNGFWSENIGTVSFQCGADSAQYKSI